MSLTVDEIKDRLVPFCDIVAAGPLSGGGNVPAGSRRIFNYLVFGNASANTVLVTISYNGINILVIPVSPSGVIGAPPGAGTQQPVKLGGGIEDIVCKLTGVDAGNKGLDIVATAANVIYASGTFYDEP